MRHILIDHGFIGSGYMLRFFTNDKSFTGLVFGNNEVRIWASSDKTGLQILDTGPFQCSEDDLKTILKVFVC